MRLPAIHDIFGDADRYFVGFEDMFDRLNSFANTYQKNILSNYPPFNVKKVDDNHYILELAVAGFGKQDLDITMKDGILTVSGKTDYSTGNENGEYLFKGIAERAFERSFTLSDTVEIKNAALVNGMLKVYLENLIPASNIKKIEIKDSVESEQVAKPQLLNDAA